MTPIEPPSRRCPTPPRRPLRCALCTLCAALLLIPLAAFALPPAPPAFPWRLVWSDEFNAPTGTPPDPAKWTFAISGKNPNEELEAYTGRSANSQQSDGNLVLTARKEDFTGPDGMPRHYTSARIRTQGHFAQAYGRFEARMRLPLGKGLWPAFWLLGDDDRSVGWPACGEIDIMENIGEATKIYSTLHGPGYSGGKAISAPFTLPAGQAVDTGFHVYAVEWAPDDIKFFFDDHLIVERTPASLPAGAHWAYDHPFYIIFNLAVGGKWPGNPDATTILPQQMLVDYVRVYTHTGLVPPVAEPAPGAHATPPR